jgi:hypothetical protein
MMGSFVELLHAWWQRDRIRVRPSEGRLFRLCPGTVLCFSTSPHTPQLSVVVVARRDDQMARHPMICYFCRGSQGEGELVVTWCGDRSPGVSWFADGESFELHADDIEVFPFVGV